MITFGERRIAARQPTTQNQVQCRLKSGLLKPEAGGGECQVVDLSPTGLGVVTLDKLPIGEDVELEITSGGYTLEHVKAFVAYCRFEDDHYRLGLVFNFRSPEMLSCQTYNFLSRMLDQASHTKCDASGSFTVVKACKSGIPVEH